MCGIGAVIHNNENINNIHEGYYCLKRFNWLEKEILSFKSNSNIIFAVSYIMLTIFLTILATYIGVSFTK